MNTKRDILLRVYISFFLFLVLGIMVISKIIKIQYVEGDYWRSLSDSLTTTYATIEPIRGNIYSADQQLLVTSLPIYEIRLDFKTKYWKDEAFVNQNLDSLCIKMSQLFRDRNRYEYKQDILAARNRQERYYLLKRNVNHNQLKKVKEFPIFNKGRFQGGFIVEQRSKRIYPFDLLAERTLGYKVKNVQGVGLEGAFNDYLSGKSGKRLMQKVSGGNWIPINIENELEPEDGQDIITTLDINIQDVTEFALLKALQEHEAESGCAVVMEVKTGNIKAIANLKRDKKGNYGEEYNFAVGASTEPGSTFKLASALVLLEKGVVKPTDIIDTKDGQHQFYDRTMRDAGEYGKISFKEAFEKSSNVAFSTLVFDYFSDKADIYYEELQKLRLTQPLGLKIAGEGKPVIKKPGNAGWSGTTLPWMSVGYELQITPIHLLTLYNAIANDGKMVKPIFATEVKKVGKTTETFETTVLEDKICSNRTLEYIKAMMKGVVENGTATNISNPNYKIAGKTGTSKIAFEGSYQKKTKYQASFAGFFPADEPRYSCIVVIYNPKAGSYYGASVAAPVFKEISDKIYASQQEPYFKKPQNNVNYVYLPVVRYGHKQDLIKISSYLGLNMTRSTQNSEWVKVARTKDRFTLTDKNVSTQTVPDVTGMTLSDAIYLLENLGLHVKVQGVGLVSKQSLKPGSRLIPSSTIYLKLS